MKLLLFIADRPFTKAVTSYAEMIARPTGAEITLMYVASQTGSLVDGEHDLDETRKLLPGFKIKQILEKGEPIKELHKEVNQGDYDMVVIGARRKIGYLQRKFSSLTQRVIKNCPLPVMMVRYPQTKLERVLICTGGLEIAEKAIHYGAQLACNVGATVTLLYVSDTVPQMYTGLEEMEESLEELLEKDTPLAKHLRRGSEILAQHCAQAEIEIQYGSVVETILEKAHSGNYDLIVLGASQAGNTLRGWLSGNVTFQIVERSNIPVLVVNSELTKGDLWEA